MLAGVEVCVVVAAVKAVELIVVVEHGLPCTCIHCHTIVEVVAHIGTKACAKRPLLPLQRSAESENPVGCRRVIAVFVV